MIEHKLAHLPNTQFWCTDSAKVQTPVQHAAGPISALAEAVLVVASRFCTLKAQHTYHIHTILHLFVIYTTHHIGRV